MKLFDPNKSGFVYGLTDSRKPKDIRYVGITTLLLKRRLMYHLNDKDVNARTKWIKSVINGGGNILIIEIESGPIGELVHKETQYIQSLSDRGTFGCIKKIKRGLRR